VAACGLAGLGSSRRLAARLSWSLHGHGGLGDAAWARRSRHGGLGSPSWVRQPERGGPGMADDARSLAEMLERHLNSWKASWNNARTAHMKTLYWQRKAFMDSYESACERAHWRRHHRLGHLAHAASTFTVATECIDAAFSQQALESRLVPCSRWKPRWYIQLFTLFDLKA
jgi:hypothetical protein